MSEWFEVARDGCGAISSRVPRQMLALLFALAAFFPAAFASEPGPRTLRVAADPNNLPFSNERREGFENALVDLIARELDARVEYTWRAQRRGFFRHTLKEGGCDLVPGVPAGFEQALTTAPYYHSCYVAVARRDLAPPVASFDDPRLHTLRIGVQIVGDDFANTPPAHALSARGITANVRGYTLYGDYAQPNPPARIVDAVAKGEIDVAFVWGPLAGYFVQRHGDALVATPLARRIGEVDAPSGQPLTFAIAVGVSRRSRPLRDELDALLPRLRPEIDALLARYAVPALPFSP